MAGGIYMSQVPEILIIETTLYLISPQWFNVRLFTIVQSELHTSQNVVSPARIKYRGLGDPDHLTPEIQLQFYEK